ncbi:zinc ribbon domain-containing protein [Pseudomonas oryzihabitans]|uniref:Serine endopeptidase n=1 Tax=Pseudomonas oryzihabitans TaxID=47885 RepID=A0A2Z5A303_9PSED|nr:zinc ribbon domain-containing protein [Pseudomonas oryzihabitans]AXA64897.1 serine endopeptidase [Pseudomonas oryzihabitans]
MGKSLRLSEKWFNRGLWLLALVFAGFLIGLGGTLVGDLPQVEQQQRLEDFMDPAATAAAREDQRQAQLASRQASDALEQAQLRQTAAASSYQANRETFDNWLATRQTTQRPEQDAELIARSRALDELKAGERVAEQEVERQQQALLDAEQRADNAQRSLATLGESAQSAWLEARQQAELRVFLYRLALTLPLLALAAWLFVRQRKSTWWPFVWGFIFFALFAFFVELVPYLPSYGGYVRYLVGILLTVLGGRYAIRALQDYRARLALKEAQPDTVRREELHYDTALARLAKGVCPDCERPVDLKDPGIDFCPHCGIGLHDHCGACQTRKSAFAHFCHACGTAARGGPGA